MSKPKRIKFVYASDNHGDKVDKKAAEALFAFCKEFKPDVRIHGGDCYDIRPYRKSADAEEKNQSLKDDIKWGNWFVQNYKPTVFMMGNHEYRLYEGVENNTGRKQELIQETLDDIKAVLRANGCKKIIPYHADKGVYTLGKVRTCHGYKCGKNAVEEHAIHYADRGGAVIIGHVHSMQMVTAQRWGGCVGFTGGCLCLKDEMSYAQNRFATSKWGTGWLYGYVEGNNWKIWQAHKVGKKWIYSHTDI